MPSGTQTGTDNITRLRLHDTLSTIRRPGKQLGAYGAGGRVGYGGRKFLFGMMKQVWERTVQMAAQHRRYTLMPLNCTLRSDFKVASLMSYIFYHDLKN